MHIWFNLDILAFLVSLFCLLIYISKLLEYPGSKSLSLLHLAVVHLRAVNLIVNILPLCFTISLRYQFVCMADFSVILNLTDELAPEEKPTAAATWGKEEESPLKNESVPESDNNAHAEKEISSSSDPAHTDTSSQNPSDASTKNGPEFSGNDVSSSEPTSDGKGEGPSSVSTTKVSER